MREIKFRGRRKDNGEWVYGFYFNMHHNDERKHIHHFIIPDNTDIPITTRIAEVQVEIYPKTLGQFTGVYDTYGKEVYEGDNLYIKEYENIAFGESTEFRDAFDLEELKGELKTKFEGVVKWEDGDMYVDADNFSLYMGSLFGNQKYSHPIFDFYITGNIHEGD